MSASQLFESDGVAANRRGQLTSAQKDTWVSVSTSGSGGCVTLALAAVIPIPVVLLFGKQLAELQGAAQLIGFAIILAVLIVAAVVVSRLYALPARRRIASAQVERRSGRVLFEGGRYRAEADGQRLRSIYHDEDNLLPGNYTFYCLKGTDWLLSMEKGADAAPGSASPFEADPAMLDRLHVPDQYRERFAEMAEQRIGEMKTQASFDLNELRTALATANGFDQRALEMNRQGKLAPDQRARLKRERGSYLRWGLLAAIFALGFVAYAIIEHKNTDPLGVTAVLVFFGGIGIVLILLSSRDSTDARRGTVETTEGTVHRFTQSTHSSRGASYTHYYYGINQMRFEVSASAYHALIENVHYRLYYVPVSKKLMGIEPVG